MPAPHLPRPRGFPIAWGDQRLFRHSSRTDAQLRDLQRTGTPRAAFEAVYAEQADPWASADPQYRYQSRKYDGIVAALPPGPYPRALELGCGLGLLGARLAPHVGTLLGIDVAQSALDRAARHTAHLSQISYRQGDLADLPPELDGGFDLVVIADTLYYLPPPITDATLAAVALRVSRLLAPGGRILLANHYVWIADRESRLTRRIHRSFAACPALRRISQHRHIFYLVDVLAARG